MRHLLLTNDFPPKVGGIQSYLWELWRRLPPDDVTVFTASYPGAEWWDSQQKFRLIRTREPVLLPQPYLARRRRAARRSGARAVVIDPAVPLGLVGPSLGLPYAVVLHGAEVTVPGRLPVSRQLLAASPERCPGHSGRQLPRGRSPQGPAPRRKTRSGVSSEQFPPVVQIPPGVDTERFRPLPQIDRAAARARLGLPHSGPLVASVSRLVPRKGMDTLIKAALSSRGPLPGHVGRDRRGREGPTAPGEARFPRPGQGGLRGQARRCRPPRFLRLRRRVRPVLQVPLVGPGTGGLWDRARRGGGVRRPVHNDRLGRGRRSGAGR